MTFFKDHGLHGHLSKLSFRWRPGSTVSELMLLLEIAQAPRASPKEDRKLGGHINYMKYWNILEYTGIFGLYWNYINYWNYWYCLDLKLMELDKLLESLQDVRKRHLLGIFSVNPKNFMNERGLAPKNSPQTLGTVPK